MVGNLARFEHKRTLFNMNNTIFSLTSGELKPEKGAQTTCPLVLTTGCVTV